MTSSLEILRDPIEARGVRRAVAASPPAEWTLKRKWEYFGWVREFVQGLRRTNAALEQAFEKAYKQRP